MDEPSSQRRAVTLVRHEDEHGLLKRGSLIPLSLATPPARSVLGAPQPRALTPLVALGLALAGITSWYAPLWQDPAWRAEFQAALAGSAATTFLVRDVYSDRDMAPAYGLSIQLTDYAYYTATREAMIAAGVSFIDVDLTKRELRLFYEGVIEVKAVFEHVPARPSWCAVSSGLYRVEAVTDNHYSSRFDVYLPSSVIFSGNRFIHGTPLDGNRVELASDFSNDCLRLSTRDAEDLAARVTPDLPVLVHSPLPVRSKAGDWAGRVPDFSTPYYLIGDIHSDTVLAAGDRHTAVPIASLTKLMTALVVIDTMPLDQMIRVGERELIESLVPRLRDQAQVSVYTLLSLLLLESSNEAAEVLAAVVGREAFVARMNERAVALGLQDTVFAGPAGMEDGNVSSAHDLWWLIRYLYLHYPFLIELTQGLAVVPETVTDTFTDTANFNKVVGEATFKGGKIGETAAAGQTSVTLHTRQINGVERVIAVVLLASQSRTEDVKRLLAYLDERYPE